MTQKSHTSLEDPLNPPQCIHKETRMGISTAGSCEIIKYRNTQKVQQQGDG